MLDFLKGHKTVLSKILVVQKTGTTSDQKVKVVSVSTVPYSWEHICQIFLQLQEQSCMLKEHVLQDIIFWWREVIEFSQQFICLWKILETTDGAGKKQY